MNAIIAIAPVRQPRPDLGPRQLQWCRAKWPVFATCERQVLAAEEHRQKLLDAVKK